MSQLAVPPSPPGPGRRRSRAFGPASEEPYRRRPSDLARLLGASLLLAALIARAQHELGIAEIDVYILFVSLPSELVPLFRALEGIGTLWALGLVVAAAGVERRWRLARDLLIAGLLAWALSRVLGSYVIGEVGLHASLRTLIHSGATPGFPVVRLSVVVAVVATAGPYLGRPARWAGKALVAALALAGMYIGLAYPKDVLGSLAVGWAVAAAIHLAFGSPGGRPSSAQMRLALARIGFSVSTVRLSSAQGLDSTVFEAADGDGPLEVKVIGRDERDAQLLAKAWRFLAYRDPPPILQLSRVQQVEHEAAMTLLAAAAGVRVPSVVFVGRAGPNAALLVDRPLPGRRLSELDPPVAARSVAAGPARPDLVPPDPVPPDPALSDPALADPLPGEQLLGEQLPADPALSDPSASDPLPRDPPPADPALPDPLLGEIWHQVALLHRAGMVHGALDAAHVVVDPDRATAGLVSFAAASTAASPLRRAKDVAEVLASTAALAGAERSVAAAIDALGPGEVTAAIPFLQVAALRPPTLALLRRHRRPAQRFLDALRRVAAARVGVDAPALRRLQRLRPANVALAASTLLAVGLLLSQVGDPSQVWATVRGADWGWAGAALGASLLTNIPYGLALIGTVPLRLPLWPTVELQLAVSYTNVVIPIIGGTGFQIRFLQRQGVDLATAITAGGLISVAANVVVQLPLFVIALVASPDALHLGRVPVDGILEVVSGIVVVLGLVAAAALGVPRLRRAVLPPLRQAVQTVWTALRSPRQLTLIIAGNLAVSLLYAACLLYCLHAFGATLSYWTVLAVSIGVGTLSSLVPFPGGSTTLGAVGLAGILAGLGIHTGTAVAVALADQLAVSYVPAIPGWFATRHLLQRDYL